MQSRGFKHTDAYREKLRSKRDVTFEATDEIDSRHLKRLKQGIRDRRSR